MLPLILALAGVPCPPEASPAACAAMDACVARVYVTRTASTGVSEREAALVSRLTAERTCGLAGWGLQISTLTALVAALKADTLCPACPPAPEQMCSEVSTGILAGLAGCGLCGIPAAIAVSFAP